MPCASITVTKRVPLCGRARPWRGYPLEKGADLWQESLRRICKHARLRWLGLYGERHMGYKTIFMDQDKAARARDFARRVMTQLPAEE